MNSSDRLNLGKLVLISAWIVTKVDSMLKWERKWRVGLQSAVFFGGFGIIRIGMDSCDSVIVTGMVLSSLSVAFAVAEILFYVFVRRYLRGRTVRSLRKALRNRQNLRYALIAARMDHALDTWLNRNCPRLNYHWVRGELEKMDLG